MKGKQKIITGLVTAFVLFNLWLAFTGKFFFYKALYYNFAGIDDYKLFANRTVAKSARPQPWKISTHYNKQHVTARLDSLHKALEPVAFLVIKDDSVCHEQYWDGYGHTSVSNSFSMAKTLVGILVGVAIKEGKIKHVDQPVADFLPEFATDDKKQITLKHLLTMSSGLNWDESYVNPLSMTTEAYYGPDLYRLIGTLQAKEKPGVYWKYLSGDTEVLAMVLVKATGLSLSEYASRSIWQPVGAENDALWSLDKEMGMEKAYCCFNSTARDFARLGKLYLNKGNWEGSQLVDSAYVAASLMPAQLLHGVTHSPVDFYGYQWWLIPDYKGQPVFYARGILGQYILVIPEKKLIIVRLGKKRGNKIGEQQEDALMYMDEVTKMFP